MDNKIVELLEAIGNECVKHSKSEIKEEDLLKTIEKSENLTSEVQSLIELESSTTDEDRKKQMHLTISALGFTITKLDRIITDYMHKDLKSKIDGGGEPSRRLAYANYLWNS